MSVFTQRGRLTRPFAIDMRLFPLNGKTCGGCFFLRGPTKPQHRFLGGVPSEQDALDQGVLQEEEPGVDPGDQRRPVAGAPARSHLSWVIYRLPLSQSPKETILTPGRGLDQNACNCRLLELRGCATNDPFGKGPMNRLAWNLTGLVDDNLLALIGSTI